MGNTFEFPGAIGGRIAVLATAAALLGGCGTVIGVTGAAVGTTFNLATGAAAATAGVVTSPFDGDGDGEAAE